MLWPVLETALVILCGIALYRYHRQLLAILKRFDEANRTRIEDERRDRADALAHFRHTLKRAEEQVEEVSEIAVSDSRTAIMVTRFLFEGRQYATKAEAEAVRADKIRALARRFYMELPSALAARREDGKLN